MSPDLPPLTDHWNKFEIISEPSKTKRLGEETVEEVFGDSLMPTATSQTYANDGLIGSNVPSISEGKEWSMVRKKTGETAGFKRG